jgi:hypothetical protein
MGSVPWLYTEDEGATVALRVVTGDKKGTQWPVPGGIA